MGDIVDWGEDQLKSAGRTTLHALRKGAGGVGPALAARAIKTPGGEAFDTSAADAERAAAVEAARDQLAPPGSARGAENAARIALERERRRRYGQDDSEVLKTMMGSLLGGQRTLLG